MFYHSLDFCVDQEASSVILLQTTYPLYNVLFWSRFVSLYKMKKKFLLAHGTVEKKKKKKQTQTNKKQTAFIYIYPCRKG